MSTTTGPDNVTDQAKSTAGRTAIAVVFAIVALAFLTAGIVIASMSADALPGFLGHLDGSTGHHPLRAVGSLLVGIVFAVASWFALKYQRPDDNRS